MSNKQTEALRLAEMYADRVHGYQIRATKETLHDMMVFRDALEAELRLLHQSEREGWRYANELEQERRRLHALNAELLEALKGCEAFLLSAGFESSDVYAEVCAAIAKAGEQA